MAALPKRSVDILHTSTRRVESYSLAEEFGSAKEEFDRLGKELYLAEKKFGLAGKELYRLAEEFGRVGKEF
jgi:hypothetical protein